MRDEYRRFARRKGKPIARALIAKELAAIVFAMITKNEPFNNTFRQQFTLVQLRPRQPTAADALAAIPRSHQLDQY